MKHFNKNNANFTFKAFKKNGKVLTCSTHNLHRFVYRLQAEEIKDSLKYYLRVFYYRALDNYGKMADFINEGVYYNKKDFIHAYKAFLAEAR